MLQQVTITSEARTSLKPLLRSAIRGELRLLAFGIARTRERLAQLEQQYGMPTAEFMRRLMAGEVDESLDFIEWQGEVKTLRYLEEQRQALEQAEVM